MKRCPKCRRDYADETLIYCLDDGAVLVNGSSSGLRSFDESATAIISIAADENPRFAQPPTVPRFWLWFTIVLSVLLLSAAGLLFFRRSSSYPHPALATFDVLTPDKTTLNLIRYPVLDIAPDGSAIVFSASNNGVSRLYIRGRNETDVRPLSGTEGAMYPVFSPDGKWIAFTADFTLKKVSLDGLVVPIIKVGDARGLAWADNEHLIYSPDAAQPLFEISADGGSPQKITTLDQAKNERTHRWPQLLPGNKVMLFTVGALDSPDNYDDATVDALNLATGERRQILRKASMAHYSPSGHLIFARGGALFSVPFDMETLATAGVPESVLQGVAGDETTGAVHYSIAGDGTLIYVPGSTSANSRGVFWADRNGNFRPLDIPPAQYNDVRISPDGTRMAILIGSSGSGDIWVHDFTRSTSTRLTFDAKYASPAWSPDGKSVYYTQVDPASSRSIVMRKPADGGRDAEAVASIADTAYIKGIEHGEASGIFDYRMNTNRGDIVRVALGSEGPVAPIVETDFNEYASALSPDGRYLAYESNENGHPDIWVRDLSGSSGRWQISTDGGEEPHWASDGRELFYRNNALFMSVAINTRNTFDAGAPKQLFIGVFNLRSNSGVSYDVDPKNPRFLMIRSLQDNTASPVRVVLNWSGELRP